MRYAVYFVPKPGSTLWQRASQWLGHDAASGETLKQPDLPEVSQDKFYDITASPRRYGFHGTMKAPFQLALDKRESELIDRLKGFCKLRESFEIAIKAGSLDGFVALLPESRSSRLDQLAGDVVKTFEEFRAPMSEADFARRNPDALSEVERDNLTQWGYPHVFDRFRFHMTLTSRLDADQAAAMQRFAESWFGEDLARPMAVDGLALFVEKTSELPFELLTYVPFGKS